MAAGCGAEQGLVVALRGPVVSPILPGGWWLRRGSG